MTGITTCIVLRVLPSGLQDFTGSGKTARRYSVTVPNASSNLVTLSVGKSVHKGHYQVRSLLLPIERVSYNG